MASFSVDNGLPPLLSVPDALLQAASDPHRPPRSSGKLVSQPPPFPPKWLISCDLLLPTIREIVTSNPPFPNPRSSVAPNTSSVAPPPLPTPSLISHRSPPSHPYVISTVKEKSARLLSDGPLMDQVSPFFSQSQHPLPPYDRVTPRIWQEAHSLFPHPKLPQFVSPTIKHSNISSLKRLQHWSPILRAPNAPPTLPLGFQDSEFLPRPLVSPSQDNTTYMLPDSVAGKRKFSYPFPEDLPRKLPLNFLFSNK